MLYQTEVNIWAARNAFTIMKKVNKRQNHKVTFELGIKADLRAWVE